MSKNYQKKTARLRGALSNILKSHQDGIYSTEEAIEAIIDLIFDVVRTGGSLFNMVKNLINLVKNLFSK